MNTPNENVLVIRRSLFDELGSFQGLNFAPHRYLDAILSRGNNFFLPRTQAENDPLHKQIIPYALLAFDDKVLYYVRGKKAGEQRLVAKGSIGIGGHMNESDESLFVLDEAAYRAGVEREVNEEITDRRKIRRSHCGFVKRRHDRGGPGSSRDRARFPVGGTESRETRGDDHEFVVSRQRRIAQAPRHTRDLVADLRRFARSPACLTHARRHERVVDQLPLGHRMINTAILERCRAGWIVEVRSEKPLWLEKLRFPSDILVDLDRLRGRAQLLELRHFFLLLQRWIIQTGLRAEMVGKKRRVVIHCKSLDRLSPKFARLFVHGLLVPNEPP